MKRAVRPRGDCPGCGYRHKIGKPRPGDPSQILPHNAPGGFGLCPGTGAVVGSEGATVTTKEVNVTEPEFVPWPKIARLANERMFITEKLDGTNACIQFHPDPENEDSAIMLCQSRNRMITPGKDNAGFATWATENQVTLFQDLGFGLHFGEWWGLGIQRNYGLTEKRFSLFNMYRWSGRRGSFLTPQLDTVPLLYAGVFDTGVIETVHAGLLTEGSNAVPGWPSPEGIVVYLTEARTSYKLTDAVVGSKPRLDTE